MVGEAPAEAAQVRGRCRGWRWSKPRRKDLPEPTTVRAEELVRPRPEVPSHLRQQRGFLLGGRGGSKVAERAEDAPHCRGGGSSAAAAAELLLLALLAEPPPAHTSASLSLTSASTTDATIGCVLIATASRRSDVSFIEGGSVCSSIASLESAAAAAAASSRAAVLWARLMAEISSVPFMR